MVQVLQSNKRQSFGEKFSNALVGGLQGASALEQKYKEQQKQSAEMEAARGYYKQLTGQDMPENISPELAKLGIDYALSGQNQMQQQSQKMMGEFESGKKNRDTMAQTFGDKFADIWEASSVGGRTALEEKALNALEVGESIEDMLESTSPPEEEDLIPEEVPQFNKGKLPEDFQYPDFTKRPKGYTQKNWADERKTWRKENAPIFEANKNHLDSVNADLLATKKLQQLSKKMPEGIERAIINPQTGEPYGLAQLTGLVSPEVQEWVKIISRFQNRAKDSFGSRVTNFDLVSYMKQFPGLLNTEEGRDRILRMMDINYDMDKLYDSALDQIYKKYGLGKIPQEKADELARKMIQKGTNKLETEFLGLDAMNKRNQNPQQQNQQLSGRMVDVVGPDGQEYEIDESEVEQLPPGFRIV